MPRKSLFGGFGKSPRVNFRVDDKVKEILQSTKDKSRFIREAIAHYWEFQGNSEISSSKIPVPEEKPIEKDEPEGVNNTWSPPWKAS